MRVVHIAWLVGAVVGCSVAPAQPDETDVEPVGSGDEALARNEDSGKTIWARQFPAMVERVTTDSAGDAYVFGWDVAKQRPTIHKYDPYGKLLWEKTLPLFYWGSGTAAGFTGSEGQIFMTGWASPELPPVDLGCGPVSGTFFVHFTTDGACAWQRTISGQDVALEAGGVDAWGRPIIAGHYTGPTNFGTYYDLTGVWATFVVSYERNGDLRWQNAFDSSNGRAVLYGLATDENNRIHLAGTYSGSFDFGGGWMTATGGTDPHENTGLLLTLDQAGQYVRARDFGSRVSEMVIGAAPDSRVVVGGRFLGSVAFGDKTLTNGSSSRDLFLARFDSGGGIRWVKKLWGSATMRLVGAGFDPWNYVSVAGRFEDSGTLNIGSYDFVAGPGAGTFAAHFGASTGGTVWARSFSTTESGGYVPPVSAAVTPNNGRILIGGWLDGTVDSGTGAMTSQREGFLVRLHP